MFIVHVLHNGVVSAGGEIMQKFDRDLFTVLFWFFMNLIENYNEINLDINL